MNYTDTYDEIKPLIDLCKAGKLFDVQEWITSGKPVNPPPSASGYKRKVPWRLRSVWDFTAWARSYSRGEPTYMNHGTGH